jgi:uncharacterized membrane protein YeiB
MNTIIFIAIQVVSYLTISTLTQGHQKAALELIEIFGTKPMPQLPIYMFSGIAIAFAIISACILISKKFENNFIIDALNKTGQLALTLYVAHVIVGMGIIEVINPLKIGNYSIEFSVGYAIVFSLLCILFCSYLEKILQRWPFRMDHAKANGLKYYV